MLWLAETLRKAGFSTAIYISDVPMSTGLSGWPEGDWWQHTFRSLCTRLQALTKMRAIVQARRARGYSSARTSSTHMLRISRILQHVVQHQDITLGMVWLDTLTFEKLSLDLVLNLGVKVHCSHQEAGIYARGLRIHAVLWLSRILHHIVIGLRADMA